MFIQEITFNANGLGAWRIKNLMPTILKLGQNILLLGLWSTMELLYVKITIR
jgi:hypothetical protein